MSWFDSNEATVSVIFRPKRRKDEEAAANGGIEARPSPFTVALVDEESGMRTQQVKVVDFEKCVKPEGADDRDLSVAIKINLPPDFGKPGAVILKIVKWLFPINVQVIAVIVQGGREKLVFPAYSHLYRSQGERVFFSGTPQLLGATPPNIAALRCNELVSLRGNRTGKRQTPDRIYDYDVYNDIGTKKTSAPLTGPRDVLGGSARLPFPRRLRTGRSMSNGKEENAPGLFYVPRDDDFSVDKTIEFFGLGLIDAIFKTPYEKLKFVPFKTILKKLTDAGLEEFTKFDDLDKLYGDHPWGYGVPLTYEDRESRWKGDPNFRDREFGRQRLAGKNPTYIAAIDRIPTGSALNDDSVPKDLLEGRELSYWLAQGRIFIVDYHDPMMSTQLGDVPAVSAINAERSPDAGHPQGFQYAPRCLMYLNSKDDMMPVAIELSLPDKDSLVYTPNDSETEWMMAKGHFMTTDSAVHQVYAHFVRCHANAEPYAIATRRQLSALHPVFRLLMPHFKDTLRINANARKSLIQAGGVVELAFNPGKFAMPLGSVLYTNLFRFKTEGLPEDLIKRGMATRKEDGTLKMTLKDYPYANDGMLLWSAIEKWVKTYLELFYDGSSDDIVSNDAELKAWWDEIKTKGHPDIVEFGYATEEEMWPSLNTVADLTQILTTIIWVVSGHHAAVNFGQYDFGGYLPSDTSMAVNPMPPRGKYADHQLNEKAYFEMITPAPQHLQILSIIRLLSTHLVSEEFLGEDIPFWYTDESVKKALATFTADVKAAQESMEAANSNPDFPSRCNVDSKPYTLLYPSSSLGQTGRGVPNSVSI